MATGLGTSLSRHQAVVEGRTDPGIGAMAAVTRQGRRYMTDVLARGDGTVMTVLTGIRGLAVIKRCDHGQEAGADVASFTEVGRERMGRVFTNGQHAVMTVNATVRGLAVIKRQ